MPGHKVNRGLQLLICRRAHCTLVTLKEECASQLSFTGRLPCQCRGPVELRGSTANHGDTLWRTIQWSLFHLPSADNDAKHQQHLWNLPEGPLVRASQWVDTVEYLPLHNLDPFHSGSVACYLCFSVCRITQKTCMRVKEIISEEPLEVNVLLLLNSRLDVE